MGIPKFYRWLSNRYPLINQPTADSVFPQYDNLYLDMNGIIHKASHPEDRDQFSAPLTREEMVQNVFQLMDEIIYLIKPQKVLLFAIDGVAPRAKMNQQRARRFRSAKDLQAEKEKHIKKGDRLPENIFDSNCITPGTEFLDYISSCIEYYIHSRINHDPAWNKLKVLFSGPLVPGEGEHKIMDFVRSEKAKPGWEANTTHCFYGADADLIMLSLVTHEPHFSVLREIYRPRRKNDNKKNVRKVQKTDYVLIHIGILREYLDLDFRPLAPKLPFGYDLERIIDDFVFICYFIGNDFLPNLPHLDIDKNSLDRMFNIYKRILPEMDGYITDGSKLNLHRCERFLAAISVIEREELGAGFSNALVALDAHDANSHKWPRQQAAPAPVSGHQALSLSDSFQEKLLIEDGDSDTSSSSSSSNNAVVLGDNDEDDDDDDEGDGQWRTDYYKTKLHIDEDDDDSVNELCRSYVEGLTWVLKYYYNGCSSWSWYFPYHYAPLATDLRHLTKLELRPIPLGKPFLPFQQLLGVLPANSATLLPAAYRDLMIDEDSPIKDFYPDDFETDQNLKRNDWEAVVIIPFIDQTRLLSCIANIDENKLNDYEKRRNTLSSNKLFRFDTSKSTPVNSPSPNFSNIPTSCCAPSAYDFINPGADWKFQLVPGVLLGAFSPSRFPTLHTKMFLVDHPFQYSNVPEEETGSINSRDRIVISLPSKFNPYPAPNPRHAPKNNNNNNRRGRQEDGEEDEADEDDQRLSDSGLDLVAQYDLNSLIGKVVYVGYPYPHEALVIGVRTTDVEIREGMINNNVSSDSFRKAAANLKKSLQNDQGIKVNEVRIIIEAFKLRKLVQKQDGTTTQLWSDQLTDFVFQTLLMEIKNRDQRYDSSISRLVPNSLVLIKQKQYEGVSAVVQTVNPPTSTVDVKIISNQVTPIENSIFRRATEKHFTVDEIAATLHLSPHVIYRVLGSIRISKSELGLQLRQEATRKKIIGFTYIRKEKNSQNGMEFLYSAKAVQLLSNYYLSVPDFFTTLERLSTHPFDVPITFQQVHPDPTLGAEIITKCLQYLQRTFATLPRIEVPFYIKTFSGDFVLMYERYLEERRRDYLVLQQSVPEDLTVPSTELISALGDSVISEPSGNNNAFTLGSRVCYLRHGNSVPFGSVATIIQINNNNCTLLLDMPCFGASNLQGLCSNFRGVQNINVADLYLLSSSVTANSNDRNSSSSSSAWNGNRSDSNSNSRDRSSYNNNNKKKNSRGSHVPVARPLSDSGSSSDSSSSSSSDPSAQAQGSISMLKDNWNKAKQSANAPDPQEQPPYYQPQFQQRYHQQQHQRQYDQQPDHRQRQHRQYPQQQQQQHYQHHQHQHPQQHQHQHQQPQDGRQLQPFSFREGDAAPAPVQEQNLTWQQQNLQKTPKVVISRSKAGSSGDLDLPLEEEGRRHSHKGGRGGKSHKPKPVYVAKNTSSSSSTPLPPQE